MGFFDFFSLKNNPDKRFISEKSFNSNKKNQVNMTHVTLGVLREKGVHEAKELKIEYFFYTDRNEKAQNLADEFLKLDYQVEYGKSAGDRNLFVVTGWTTKLNMDDSTVINWVIQMCDLGFKHDCDFDGWGTNPDQN